MELGEKVVCLYDDWYCAFGKLDSPVQKGQVLTVQDETYVAGSRFLAFVETPEGCLFLSHGFRPHNRRLN